MILHQVSLVVVLLMLKCGLGDGDVADSGRPFLLTGSPSRINRYMNTQVTLDCEHNPSDTSMTKVFRMKIARKSELGWTTIVEQRDIWNSPRGERVLKKFGNIPDDISEAHLQVVLSTLDATTYGIFMCTVIGYDSFNDFVSSKTLELNIQESEIPTKYLLDIVIEHQHQLDRLKEETKTNNIELQTAIKDLQQSMSEFFKNQSALQNRLDNVQTNLSMVGNTERYVTSKILELETFRNSTIQWPAGFYALLQPKTGCPVDMAFFGGTHRFQKFHVQRKPLGGASSSKSHSSAFSNTTHFHADRKGYFSLEFCEVTKEFNTSPWPRGSFCVNKILHHRCPGGFSAGSVLVDTEDRHRSGDARNNVADRIVNPTLYFCCQRSASPLRPVRLPTSSPFLLYRLGGSCQLVEGMAVNEEFVRIHTETDGNGNQVSSSHGPDLDLENRSSCLKRK
ncbi:hypothetical protein RRG08_017278 [Elysia crispata]|uniref:Apextrin C-terminal domain-containing protein n=1 Tax=Elysia crispata TaxID=231223 RepID=A0AAE0XQU0_9GAST|nr:hypothetical protein RRG08_017278 [Elysia crispata]